ncbi:MAG: hypothetical protein K2P17_05675 [Helicobacteraceae bacterium]|nr:hypothetical protein [Helicobacteraceae bacterium]
MEIYTKLESSILRVTLNGKLKNYNEYIEIKSTIKTELKQSKNISFYFVNATSIDSYILGYILKLYEVDKINVDIVVGSSRLYNFLRNIDFDKFFKIKIKEYIE